MGFNIEEHHLQQADSATGFEDYALDAATYLSAFNKGAMLELQGDPTDETQQCAVDTAATNAELLIMADFAQYTAGGFDAGEFYRLMKIAQLKQMDQYASCDFIPLLIAGDGMLSNLPNAAAAGMNVLTQLGTGWTDKDTSIYIGWDDFQEGYGESDEAVKWQWYGSASMLTLSQILKIQAGAADIDVSPTSS